MLNDQQLQEILANDHVDFPQAIVGAAVVLDEHGFPGHAGIVVIENDTRKLFHYTGTHVELVNIDTYAHCYFKSLYFVKSALIPSFLSYCEIVLVEARPQYGFFYSGSLYDMEGNFKAPGDFPEYMTCVGFCLNVLQGFLPDDNLIDYEGWDGTTLNLPESYVNRHISEVHQQNPGILIDDILRNLRRIYPIDYFAGSFSTDIPITKHYTDTIVPQLLGYFQSKVA